MIVWFVLGVGVWLAAVGATCAVLTAAKRADAAWQMRASAPGSIAGLAAPYAHGLLGTRVDSVVIAFREPRRTGQIVVVAAYGTAAGLIGRILPPDDFVAALAALTGRCERRDRAVAVPLRRRDETIGAISLTVPAGGSPVEPGEMARLLKAADAISMTLSDRARARPASASRHPGARDAPTARGAGAEPTDRPEPDTPGVEPVPPPGGHERVRSTMCRQPSVIPLPGLRVGGLCTGSDVVRLEGELDLASRGMLCSLVPEGPARDMRIDTSGLEFIDCAGLAALLELAHRTRAAGHRFEFTAVSQPLSRLAHLTGTTTRLLSTP